MKRKNRSETKKGPASPCLCVFGGERETALSSLFSLEKKTKNLREQEEEEEEKEEIKRRNRELTTMLTEQIGSNLSGMRFFAIPSKSDAKHGFFHFRSLDSSLDL